MEKDIGKVKKNADTDIIVRVDDYGGKRGITIREFTTSERYTGFTKSGTRIPVENFLEFRELINKISLSDLNAADSGSENAESPGETAKEELEKAEEDY